MFWLGLALGLFLGAAVTAFGARWLILYSDRIAFGPRQDQQDGG